MTELPGPKARAHIAFDEAWTSPSLPRAYPIVPVRGEGLTVEDIDGNLFLDFAAGIAVTSTGHGHPGVVARIQAQAEELIHFSASDFYLPIYAEVCRELARLAPIEGPARAYLGNSGTEVVEAAIKLARHATGRPYIVAFLGAFHGRTYGSVSLTASKAKYHAGFGPLLPGVYHAPFGKVDDLRWFDEVLFDKLVPANEVAAIVVEPIQGEGGYIVPEDGFLEGLRAICDKHGILLVADEIQSGAGRTGKMWAVEHWGVKPDILLTAKGIASGMPLGALVARADLLEHWGPGRARVHVRRQPARLCGGARHDRPARGRPRRERGGPRRPGDGRPGLARDAPSGRRPRGARQGPDDRHRVRHRRPRRRRPDGGLPARPARPGVRQVHRPDVPGAHGLLGRGRDGPAPVRRGGRRGGRLTFSGSRSPSGPVTLR